MRGRVEPRITSRPSPAPYRWNGCIAALAASTGGVEAISRVLEAFPSDGPPVLVVQHMPGGGITGLFADRIDRHLQPHVVEAANGMPIAPGTVYIAPGGERHLTVGPGDPLRCCLVDAAPVAGHRPSADMLFHSLAALPTGKVVAVILTGMGDDGAQGMLQLRGKGMRTIGQDRASALVYGMPRIAAERGAVEEVLALDRIGERILALCQC